ncbi:MAG: DegT/DnrJ/EryC1/StrS family aminotransferase [Phycisphaerales bacterium]|nr:DegT/DnrJ/EryC1/StrS family aminotransferase [Phycisphaerales bacterium]
MRSGRLSMGPTQEVFEGLVAEAAGCDHGVAVNSGTSGLHLALLALGIGPGDEVITTPFSFVASANAILYVGATPKFVDICPRSLNMDPDRVEAAIGPRTKAILAVEALGNPTHMDRYAAIAAKHEIHLIEDCCEALGTEYKGRKCGSFGRVGVFGFYPNKQITTGEGGMIVTDDARLADLSRSLRNQGRPMPSELSDSASLGMWLSHERLGYNYRLSDIACAIGVAQMHRFEDIMEARRSVAVEYLDRLMGMPGIILPTIESGTSMSWFVFTVRLERGYTAEERDRVIQGLRNHDIGAAAYFPCIHLMPEYIRRFGYEPGTFPIAESVSDRTIALPFHNRITPRDIDLVAQTLSLMLTRENLARG